MNDGDPESLPRKEILLLPVQMRSSVSEDNLAMSFGYMLNKIGSGNQENEMIELIAVL